MSTEKPPAREGPFLRLLLRSLRPGGTYLTRSLSPCTRSRKNSWLAANGGCRPERKSFVVADFDNCHLSREHFLDGGGSRVAFLVFAVTGLCFCQVFV